MDSSKDTLGKGEVKWLAAATAPQMWQERQQALTTSSQLRLILPQSIVQPYSLLEQRNWTRRFAAKIAASGLW